jgi:biofilm PGA synthesis protein PgaA
LHAEAIERVAQGLDLGNEALRRGDRYSALKFFAEARLIDPSNTEVTKALSELLLDLGAPYGASGVLGKPASLNVRSRQIASRVRWGSQIKPRDPAFRFKTTDAALRRLDSLLVEVRKMKKPERNLLIRLQSDRIVALRDRERWSDVLVASRELRSMIDPLPPYVRHAEADALLALRRPHEARRAYQETLDAYAKGFPSGILPRGPNADPEFRKAIEGRFYAEVEDEDFASAFATADALTNGSQPALYTGVDPLPQPNMDWLENKIVSAQARSYAEMHADAWNRIAPLAAGAPALAYLRSVQSSVAADRGWPRQSEEEIEIASSLAPDDLGVKLGLANSDLRRRNWKRAEKRIDALAILYPNDPQLILAQTNLAIYKAPEFFLDIGTSLDSGGAQNGPGAGLDLSERLYSSPIAERWRVLETASRSTSRPVEGEVERNRVGVGVEGRWADFKLEAIGWQNFGTLSEPGASLNLQWEADDRWTFTGDAERFAADTPMRALYYGIRADAVGGAATYAWNESTVASAGVRGLDFTDGNQRVQGTVDFAQKVIDQPLIDLTLKPILYSSMNTSEDVPYFNPRRDLSGVLEIDAVHLLWRSYESNYRQRFVVTAGSYWQSDFGSAPIGSIRYEQIYHVSPATELNYGVQLSRNVYDGESENSLGFFFSLKHSFQ